MTKDDINAKKIEILKKVSTEFFRWWWNKSGTNTDDGFDLWWESLSLNQRRQFLYQLNALEDGDE